MYHFKIKPWVKNTKTLDKITDIMMLKEIPTKKDGKFEGQLCIMLLFFLKKINNLKIK